MCAQKDDTMLFSEASTTDGTESTTSEVSSPISSAASGHEVYPPLLDLPAAPMPLPLACPWLQHLVWCNERSYKQDSKESRDFLEKEAEKLGAQLVCLKKADKLKMWLQATSSASYLLLTSWREFKPCMQVLSHEGHWKRPVLPVVLCEGPVQFTRAASWVEELLACGGDRAQVIAKVEVLPEIIAHLPFMMEQTGYWSCPTPLPMYSAIYPPMLGFSGCGPIAVSRVALDSSRCEQSENVKSHVEEVLSPICGHLSNEDVHQLLRDAMPDHYED